MRLACHLLRLTLSGCLMMICFFAHAESIIPQSERRSVEQTFLTYPEWFLVYSPAEYANLVKTRPAHDFPFLGHIDQLWSSYAAVTREQIRSGLPANASYHVMIMVIATSTTLEYGLRSLYENSIGRSSYFLSSGNMTEEEIVGADIAQQYVDFIRHDPWYLFDFMLALKRLWTDTSILGEQPLRKLERRFALTTEYVAKALYAELIKFATHMAYEEAKMTTWVVVSGFKDNIQLPEDVKLQKDLGQGRAILILPRYDAFGHAAQSLARQGMDFEDIAGNDSNILVTCWRPANSDLAENYPVLFKQPLITQPQLEKRALNIPIHQLSNYLRTDVQIEHVYDY